MTRVWPADTATGGISFLAADLGNLGALAGPKGFEGTESVQSMEMGNWTGERDLDIWIKEEQGDSCDVHFFVSFYPNASSTKAFRVD